MVLASIYEHASTAFYMYFSSTSSDHICLASSEHFINSNPFSISRVVLVTCYSYKNGIRYLLYLPFSTLKGYFISVQKTYISRFTKFRVIENPSMRAIAKILRARASEHLSNFCEQRPNFAST